MKISILFFLFIVAVSAKTNFELNSKKKNLMDNHNSSKRINKYDIIKKSSKNIKKSKSKVEDTIKKIQLTSKYQPIENNKIYIQFEDYEEPKNEIYNVYTKPTNQFNPFLAFHEINKNLINSFPYKVYDYPMLLDNDRKDFFTNMYF